MKRHALGILVLLNVGLACVLAALWLEPDGTVRNARWQAPAPIQSNYLEMLPVLPERSAVDTSQFLALLERPLFSMTRRPPPPPPPPQPPAPPPPVDHLATAKLYGAFAGENTGGVILQISGKTRRLRLNEALDGWVLQAIQPRSVTLTRNGETRVLQLSRAAVSTYSGVAQPVVTPTPLPAPPPQGLAQAQAQAAALAATTATAPVATPPLPPAANPSPAPASAPRRSLFGP